MLTFAGCMHFQIQLPAGGGQALMRTISYRNRALLKRSPADASSRQLCRNDVTTSSARDADLNVCPISPNA